MIPLRYKWVIVLPEGIVFGYRKKPKKIAGGYLTTCGRRFVRDNRRSFNIVELIRNKKGLQI